MGNCMRAKLRRMSTHTPASADETHNALVELIETERAYREDLLYLDAHYLDPLRTESLFFDRTELIVHNNVTLDLIQFQSKFLHKIELAVETLHQTDTSYSEVICKVADAFIESEAAKDFEIYNKYVMCQSRINKIISKSTGVEKIFTFFDKKYDEVNQHYQKEMGENAQKLLQRKKMMTMESLIMKPFQRVLLYPLILERILIQCEKGTMDRDKVEKAIHAIKNVAQKMNETLKRDEKSDKDFKQLTAEYGVKDYPNK